MLFEEVLPGLRAGKQYIADKEVYRLVDRNLQFKDGNTWKFTRNGFKFLLESDWTLYEEPPKELNFFEAVAVLGKGGKIGYWKDDETVLTFHDDRIIAMSEGDHLDCNVLHTNITYREVKS